MTIRLTAAQAMLRYLVAQGAGDGTRLLAGCRAIFGHGNVAGPEVWARGSGGGRRAP